MFQVEARLRARLLPCAAAEFSAAKINAAAPHEITERRIEWKTHARPLASEFGLRMPNSSHSTPQPNQLPSRNFALSQQLACQCAARPPAFFPSLNLDAEIGSNRRVLAWSMAASWSGRALSCVSECQVSNIPRLQSWSLLVGSSAFAQIARYPRIRARRLRSPHSGWGWLLHHALISAERASCAYPCLQPRAHRMHFILPNFESPRRSRLGS